MTFSTKMKRDPCTLSNYDTFLTTHSSASLFVDFTEKCLTGNVLHKLKALKKIQGEDIVLDTSYLDIKDVLVDGKSGKWHLDPRVEPYGSALRIQVDRTIEAESFVVVKIFLRTTAKCTALQWFGPEQTSNQRHPYVFSQCQAIHARSILPCQDTPDVKGTFGFNIRSPLPVLASGLSTGCKDFIPGIQDIPGTLLYTFRQDTPIPSYLFALASGDIATAAIGPRSLVATGPEELQAAKWELEEHTERFIQVAERIIGVPYAWTTYNVLVLPASFPLGGMENPVFTYATPTIISGDRENVDVVAHELAHSWSGNLVSNASWEHFWLNEGWSVYLERRILAELHGEAYRSFSAIIGWKALTDSIERFGENHEFTKLIVNLDGKDPDDASSSVPYEKGSTFLLYLEQLIGKATWDPFIPHYFSTFARKSIDSSDFQAALLSFFASHPSASHKLHSVDWQTWLHAPGYPPKPAFDTSLVDACYALADKWDPNTPPPGHIAVPDDIAGWSANQIVVFLERVEQFEHSLLSTQVRSMADTYGFAKSQNVEVLTRFYRVALRARLESIYPLVIELLGRVGRMKFVRPLYKYLKDVDRDLAIATFKRHESFYHPLCRQLVRKDLFGDE